MTLPELLAVLASADVRLSLRLVVDAPAGTINPDLRSALIEHKPSLLARLGRDAEWEALRDMRWGPAVDDPSPGIDNPGRRPRLEMSDQALAADPYALAEREPIRAESGP